MYKALCTKQGLQFTVQEIIKLIADPTQVIRYTYFKNKSSEPSQQIVVPDFRIKGLEAT